MGAALPLSGPVAAFGHAQRRGLERAVARVNRRGGVDVAGERREVELVVLDHRGDADVAGQRALVLVRRRAPVAALLGACAPPLTVVRVAEAREVPLVSGCGPLPLPDTPVAPGHTWQLGPGEGEHAAAVVAALGPAAHGPVALLTTAGRSASAHAAALAAAGQAVAGTWARGPAGPQGAAGWQEAVHAAQQAGATRVLALTEPPDGLALWRELDRQGWRPRAAYVRDAGLTGAWPSLRGGDGVLTDLHGPPGRTPEQVAEQAAGQAMQVLLDALSQAGSARRGDVDRALAGTAARLLGSPGPGTPPQLGVWRDGGLVTLPRG